MDSKRLFSFLIIFSLIIPSFVFCADPMSQALLMIQAKKYPEAIKLYIKVRQLYPDSDWYRMSYLMSAKVYEKMGKPEDAIYEYKDIITKFPGTSLSEEAYFAIGRIRSSQRLESAAIKAYESYLSAFPKGEYAVMALFDIASLYKTAGKNNEALANYLKILKYYPGDNWFYSWAAIYSGHIYMGKHDYNNAIESYQRVPKSDDNMFLYTLSELHRAQAFMDKGDFGVSKALFSDIVKSNRHFQEEALYGLGKAHYKLGEYGIAKEVYVSMLEMYPATVWREKVEKGLKLMEKKLKNERINNKDDEL